MSLIDFEGDIPAIAPIVAPAEAPVTPEKIEETGDVAKKFNVEISDETLKQYVQACEDVRTYTAEQIDFKLQDARSMLDHTRKMIKHVKSALAKYQEVVDKEAKAVKELVEEDKWYFGKVLKGKKKHNEKVERHLEDLHNAEEALQQQETQLISLGKTEAMQYEQVQTLAKKASVLKTAKEYEAAVVEHCFSGAAGDKRENDMENTVSQLKAQLTSMGQYKVAYSSAEKSLNSANNMVQQALQFYGQARRLAGADIAQDFFSPAPMMNGPAGIMIDVRKRQTMEAAIQAMGGAAQMVLDAKRTLPSIPDVDIERIGGMASGNAGPMMDVVFDNIVTDMRMRRKIEEDMMQCQWLAEQVRTALRWVQQWQTGRIDRDLADLHRQCAAQQAALDAYRRDCIKEMIATKKLGKVAI